MQNENTREQEEKKEIKRELKHRVRYFFISTLPDVIEGVISGTAALILVWFLLIFIPAGLIKIFHLLF